MTPALIVLVAAGPLVILVVLFFGIGWLFSVIGGWRALAVKYRATSPPEGRAARGIYGRIGVVNYNRALTVYVSPAGLYLSAIIFFRPSHPDLFIPASEIGERRPFRMLWSTGYEMSIGKPEVTTIALPAWVFDDNRH